MDTATAIAVWRAYATSENGRGTVAGPAYCANLWDAAMAYFFCKEPRASQMLSLCVLDRRSCSASQCSLTQRLDERQRNRARHAYSEVTRPAAARPSQLSRGVDCGHGRADDRLEKSLEPSIPRAPTCTTHATIN